MTGFVRDVALGMATGLPMLVVVGPIALLLVDVGVRRGLRAGSPAALGVALGDVVLAVVVAVAGTALGSRLAPVADQLRIAAAALVAAIAVHAVLSVRRAGASDPDGSERSVPMLAPAGGPGVSSSERGTGRLLGGFAALTLANPLTLLVYTGVVVGGGAGVGTAGWVTGMGLASLAVHHGWIGVGHVVGSALPSGALRVARYVAAGLLLGLAVHLLVG
ncbi:MAG TPA: LysE family transporter [Microthrixaceae bacterium]|nr:LysE family transporter [Microthrixaceae bacterium]HNN38670.1 LysE family transporter [Microthrixaceae bacterium]